MGEVFRAIDTSLNRQVAIKLLQKEMANDPHFIENFSREARAAAALNHHNIVQIYSFGQEAGQYFLAMELVDRGSLDDIISSKKPLSEAQVIEIGLQVATALRSAWTRGVAHHDIKPGNILFNEEGVAKIVDFGLAQFAKEASGKTDPHGNIWGTPYYVPPEKLESKRVDFRGDIYSLGATLFHAIANRPPFEGPDLQEVASRRLREIPPSVRKFHSDTSEATAKIVARMMGRKPEDRYETYDALIADLTAAKRAAFSSRQKINEAAQELHSANRNRLVRRLATAGIGVLVIVLVLKNLDTLAHVPVIGNIIAIFRVPTEEQRNHSSNNNSSTKIPGGTSNATTGTLSDESWLKRFEPTLTYLSQANYTQAADDCRSIELTPGLTPKQKNTTVFLHGIIYTLRGNTEEGESTFNSLAGNKPISEVPKVISAENISIVLANLMLGDLPPKKLAASLNNLPAGARQLARFTLGINGLSGDDNAQAESVAFFGEFAAAPRLEGEWEWVDRLRPAAAGFRSQYDRLQTTLREAKELRDADKWEAAIARLDATGIQPPITATAFRSRVIARRKEYEIEWNSRKATHAAEESAKFEEERKKIGLLDAQVTPLVNAFSFAPVASAYAKLNGQITTADGKALLEKRSKTFQLLADLKQAAVTGIATNPLPANTLTLGGKQITDPLTSATESDASFKTQFGAFVRKWQTFPPTELAKVLQYYMPRVAANSPEPTRSAAAERYLGLAIFYREYKLSETEAIRFASYAAQLHPGSKELIRKFFPAIE